MNWVLSLVLIVALLIIIFFSAMPIAFAFMTLNFICLYIWAGGPGSWFIVVNSAFESMTSTVFLAVPPFILMGEILFHTGTSWLIIDALDRWVGRIPGRLSILAILSGVVLATLTGSSLGSVVMIGSVLVSEMYKRGYSASMVLGPCAASGGLAILIPPTMLGIIAASLVKVSVGDFLIAIIIPGLILSALYFGYVLLRAGLQPALAPPYQRKRIPLSEKMAALPHILSLAIVIFLVLGVIFLGVATPSEAAALGVIGVLIVCAIHQRLSWEALRKAVISCAKITVMLMTIVMGSMAFSQLMAYTGAAGGLAAWAGALQVPKFVLYLLMISVMLCLGCVMDGVAVMMISIPIFVPIVKAAGFDLVWFTVVLLVGVETGMITPPFGLNLFAIKGVAQGNTMGQVFKSTFPFVICCVILLLLLYAFPQLATWLPLLMHRNL